MPPTIQTNLNAERDKRPPRPGEKRSELVTRVKYCNTLPDIPFDPKFITYPFASRRFIEYNPTSLERNYKYEVLTEHDLGVTIDLINKDLYTPDYNQQLDPADEKLLEEDILTPQDSKRSRHHGLSVSWLRRTEYISTEQTRFQPQTMDKVEAKVGYSIKKNFKDDTLYMDRESQIKAIEKTFVDAKEPIEKHYSKPNVVPVEVFPIFPDFKLWKYPCAQVIFDSDPAPTGRSVPAQIEEMSQAMIRGVMDESGEQFVAYFLPTETTLEKRRQDFLNNVDYVDEEEYDYKMAREYNWNVKSKASKGYEENYFLVMRQDGVFYNELETRVRLSKRRQKAGQQVNNTRLVVCHRTLNANEFKMQRYREKQLEPANEEEDEEDEEEEEATQEQTNDKSDDDKGKDDHGSDKDESGKDKAEGNEGDESEKEGSEKARTESDQEKGESDKDESEKEDNEKRESDKGESERENNPSDNEKAESGDEKAESGDEKVESGDEKAESGDERDESGDEGAASENEKRGSEKEDSDGERNQSEPEQSENTTRNRGDKREAKSSSDSDSGSASENEVENKGEDVDEKMEVASRSSRSRSSSRSHSQPRQRSASRSASPSPSRSPSASGSDSE